MQSALILVSTSLLVNLGKSFSLLDTHNNSNMLSAPKANRKKTIERRCMSEAIEEKKRITLN